jgi:arachidonate 15-lipoxygenase
VAARTAVGKQWWQPGLLKWFLRRGFWNFLAFVKFRAAKPADIGTPSTERWYIEPKPMIKAIPQIPLHNVRVCTRADIPREERSLKNTIFFKFQVWLYTTQLSPMQQGLPPIHEDPRVALKRAYRGLRRTLFDPPAMPAEYSRNSPDLGSLAVRGPFACYTTWVKDSADWEWNLLSLNKYEHDDGLMEIGSRVLFRLDKRRRALEAYSIECPALNGKPIRPADADWDRACEIALCAASTHLSLVRHFNWVHLAGGAQLAIATRNCLSADHPLCRLLWPFIFGTQQSNDMVTRAQMLPGGDFEKTFSLKFTSMCDLFDDTYLQYRDIVNDPERDGNSRGVCGAGFDTPTQDNLEELFKTMHDFTRNYVEIYYSTKATGADSVRSDQQVMAWLAELNKRLPKAVSVTPRSVNRDRLARLLANQLYLVTVQHEILGSFMWNYQLWTHRQPARIYEDFRREPLDVYQRLVNANYILNVRRRALMHDFSYMTPDHRAKAAMFQFQKDLATLQAKMDSQPRAIWLVYPSALNVNINA